MTQLGNWSGITRFTFGGLMVFLIVACGSGSSSPQATNGDEQINSDVTGIWKGTFEENNGETFSGIGILYRGELQLVSQDTQAIYLGTYSVNGPDFSASMEGYKMGGGHFTTTQISGTFANDHIEGTFATSYDTSGAVSFSFDTIYNRSTSFEQLQGNWSYRDSDYTVDITIDALGALSGVNSNNCKMTGSFSLSDPLRNLFILDVDITQCEDVDGQYAGYAIVMDENTENDTLLFIISNDQRVISYQVSKQNNV